MCMEYFKWNWTSPAFILAFQSRFPPYGMSSLELCLCSVNYKSPSGFYFIFRSGPHCEKEVVSRHGGRGRVVLNPPIPNPYFLRDSSMPRAIPGVTLGCGVHLQCTIFTKLRLFHREHNNDYNSYPFSTYFSSHFKAFFIALMTWRRDLGLGILTFATQLVSPSPPIMKMSLMINI